MPAAIIRSKMDHWPPHTVLVHLDEPIPYYDRETGEQYETRFIAVNTRHPDIHSADHARVDVYPCDSDGNFVEDMMCPIRKIPYDAIKSVLEDMGYDVVDENKTLVLIPGGR